MPSEAATPRLRWTGVAEAVAFTGLVLTYIWIWRDSQPWTGLLLLAAVAVSFWLHGETLWSLGLSPRVFVQTLRDWRYAWALGTGVMIGLTEGALFSGEVLIGAILHTVWCTFQQVLLQGMIYHRLRDSLGPRPVAWIGAGLCFAAVHWPNPALVPATFAWGAASCALFERWKSAVALAFWQTMLSYLLFEVISWEYHHGLRVGPGFYQ